MYLRENSRLLPGSTFESIPCVASTLEFSLISSRRSYGDGRAVVRELNIGVATQSECQLHPKPSAMTSTTCKSTYLVSVVFLNVCGVIRDLRMPSHALCQWESNLRESVSHWIRIQQAVISAAAVHYEHVGAIEGAICANRYLTGSGSSKRQPQYIINMLVPARGQLPPISISLGQDSANGSISSSGTS